MANHSYFNSSGTPPPDAVKATSKIERPIPSRRAQADDERSLPDLTGNANASAMATLYEAHRDRLIRIASRTLSNGDAEDVVQNTFARLWLQPTAPQITESIGGYLDRALAWNIQKWL